MKINAKDLKPGDEFDIHMKVTIVTSQTYHGVVNGCDTSFTRNWVEGRATNIKLAPELPKVGGVYLRQTAPKFKATVIWADEKSVVLEYDYGDRGMNSHAVFNAYYKPV